MSTLAFIREVLAENRSTGAFSPSSKELTEAITGMVDLKSVKSIVEYGPGTGVFTEAILRKKHPDAYFLAMEVNPRFAEFTQERCPRAHVVNDCAQNTHKYLKKAGFDHCDVIISGLPWTRFDAPLQDSILEATYDVLAPGGHFLTFGYSFSLWFPAGRRFFKQRFPRAFPKHTVSAPIWKNIPPCSVYIGER